MKIGLCESSIKEIKLVYKAGFDYVEVSNIAVYQMDDAKFSVMPALK